jgi:bacterioferritin
MQKGSITMANAKTTRGKAAQNGHGSEIKDEVETLKASRTSRHAESPDEGDVQSQIIAELKLAYASELETVINYLSNSIHLDGILAQEIRESLKEDIEEELGHAKEIAERLKILGSDVPGSLDLKFTQASIQPPKESTDVLSVIKGVIDAENAAIEQYEKLIELADDADDYVTEDMCVQILANEQHHKREFEGFLKSREKWLK